LSYELEELTESIVATLRAAESGSSGKPCV